MWGGKRGFHSQVFPPGTKRITSMTSQGVHAAVQFPERWLSGVPWAPDIWDMGPRQLGTVASRNPHSHAPEKGEAPKETRAHSQGSAALS